MNISRISRSIIVAIFVVFIIFLGFINISNNLTNGNYTSYSISSILLRISLIIAVMLLSFIYMYIKDKLYKKHVKKRLSYVYRYIYIIFVLLVSSIFSIRDLLSSFSDSMMLFSVVMSLIIALTIKKIIFNVSKGDLLSVIGMFTYAILPKTFINKEAYILSTLFTAIFVLAIFVFQKLIDELKQKGIKTKKYLIESLILGTLLGISTIFGANVFLWCVVLIIAIFITYNLDNTHINFPKAFMASLTQARREELYKIERININKIFVSILIAVIILLVINIISVGIITNINSTNEIVNYLVMQINENALSNFSFHPGILISQMKSVAIDFMSFGPLLYILLFAYILFMEILAFCLRRRYDTKSTLMKVIFLALFVSIVIFNLNIYYFTPALTILLILIAIVNTSNIYLNREERIKMLVA